MYFIETEAKQAFDLSPHKHYFLNPYHGCSMGCPFCFWLSIEGWEGKIEIRKNIPGLLEKALPDFPKDEYLYLGSVCDPFNELEAEYRLTESCLGVLQNFQVPLLITTSGVRDILLEEAELLLALPKKPIVVVELARLPEIEKMKKGGSHKGIETANRLKAMGLTVYATVAPICPGIIEAEPFLERLREDIPIYIDSLQCRAGSIQAKRMKQLLGTEYPELLKNYTEILGGDTSYFHAVLKRYENCRRICTFPYKLV